MNAKDLELYDIEQIIDHRWNRKLKINEYLIKWEGYEETTWESETSLNSFVPGLIEQYRKQVSGENNRKFQQVEERVSKTIKEKGIKVLSKSISENPPHIVEITEAEIPYQKESQKEENNKKGISEKSESNSKKRKISFKEPVIQEEEQFIPLKILGMKREGQDLFSLVQYNSQNSLQSKIVENKYLRDHYPKILVDYYEKRIEFK